MLRLLLRRVIVNNEAGSLDHRPRLPIQFAWGYTQLGYQKQKEIKAAMVVIVSENNL